VETLIAKKTAAMMRDRTFMKDHSQVAEWTASATIFPLDMVSALPFQFKRAPVNGDVILKWSRGHSC
jgi:hypothetical protein